MAAAARFPSDLIGVYDITYESEEPYTLTTLIQQYNADATFAVFVRAIANLSAMMLHNSEYGAAYDSEDDARASPRVQALVNTIITLHSKQSSSSIVRRNWLRILRDICDFQTSVGWGKWPADFYIEVHWPGDAITSAFHSPVKVSLLPDLIDKQLVKIAKYERRQRQRRRRSASKTRSRR